MSAFDEQRETILKEYFELLRFPTIGAEPMRLKDCVDCAMWLKKWLTPQGFAVELMQAPKMLGTPPILLAERKGTEGAPTVLFYGHYDVQPPEPLEKWKTDPFEPVIHDDAIWCRGANDDKGQLFMHIKAFEFLMRTGQLKHNVKFIFEGEEEIGSPSLPEFIKANKELLKADICLVSDTTMISEKVPSINCGMRGLAYLEVKVTGPNKDLHSGHYGGAVANPINVLCDMISSLIDKDGRITVPGFYDKVVELTPDERKMLARAPFDIDEYKQFLDINEVKGEKGYTTMERTGIRHRSRRESPQLSRKAERCAGNGP